MLKERGLLVKKMESISSDEARTVLVRERQIAELQRRIGKARCGILATALLVNKINKQEEDEHLVIQVSMVLAYRLHDYFFKNMPSRCMSIASPSLLIHERLSSCSWAVAGANYPTSLLL